MTVTGLLGILLLASERKLLDIAETFLRLRQTSFYCPDKLLRELLEKHKGQTR